MGLGPPRLMRTKVKSERTMRCWIYTLPPAEALRACYIQQVLRKYDTWNYSEIELPEFVKKGNTLSYGEFVATSW